ncbi:MAG: MarC family protein [Elainella sp. C42_A2020_010]|nr:MarC family protein [Elainella sp. C42_A2020_010]RNJ67279.1 MAG: MarC family protein [Leptolyngbya sp. IPPAS B-1204]
MTQVLRRRNRLYWLVVLALVFMIMGAKGMSTKDSSSTVQITPTEPTAAVVAQSPETPLPPSTPSTTPQPVVTDWRKVADAIATAPTTNKATAFNLFIIFFVTLGPLKIIPAFVQLTAQADSSLRRQMAFRSTLLATAVILFVAIIGQNMVRVWRVQLPALMLAAGILLFLVSLNMVMTQYGAIMGAKPAALKSFPDPPSLEAVVSPLTFPTILPPFGIAIALTIVVGVSQLGLDTTPVLGLLLLVMLLNLLGMLAARPILGFLRPVTLQVLGFALAVMQLALGIEFILSGIELQALVIQRMMAL